MAASKKKKVEPTSDTYNKLEEYCIWLNEFYTSLLRAGFKHDIALAIMLDKDSFPDWVQFGTITDKDVSDYLEDEDD